MGCRLAYCELYVTIGTLLRRYPNMKTEKLEGRSLEYEDYFAPYRPDDSKLFNVWVEA
jgi:cytochrome P450